METVATLCEADPLRATVLANPDDTAPRLILADFLEELGLSEHAGAWRAGKVIVDNDTYLAVRHLAVCRFTPGSWAKRFAREMREQTTDGRGPMELTITVKQWAWVWRLVWKYRRQLGRHKDLLGRCRRLGVPDLDATPPPAPEPAR